ncbi:MAG: hypothetical protein ABII23_02605 [bacterium]
MNISAALLKAEHIGIKDLKEHLSAKYLDELLIITDRGDPISVTIPYTDVLEFIDIFEELSDKGTLKMVREGREAIKAGAKGISVSHLFKKIRSKRK